MQNQNVQPWSWGQGSVQSFPAGQAVLPTTFTAAGVDQNPLLPSYQQMYGNSTAQTPPDYNQWTSTQFSQWQQWQQWQEKYQQWQAQYGKKYAESLAAIGQNPSLLMAGFSPVAGTQKAVEAASGNAAANPPLPVASQPAPPPPPEEEKPPLPNTRNEGGDDSKTESKDNPEDLSEAEKTFDVQFKQWENQFNEWKKENQDHPDKAQYREYEKKWETWREQLLQRREQMRKKRLSKAMEQSNEAGAKAENSKSKATATGPSSVQSTTNDTEYGYRTQPPPALQNPFASEIPKFDMKPPFFDRPPPLGQSLNNFNQRGNQDRNSVQGNHFMKDMDSNRGQPFNQNSGRAPFQPGMGSQGLPPRLEGGPMEGNFSQRFRNASQFDGPRYGSFDGFSARRMGGAPKKFSGDNYRAEREFSQHRFFDSAEKEAGPRCFDGGDMRPEMNQPLPLKPKVPSLFDITVEKPLGLLGLNKTKHYDDVFEKKEPDRNNKSWGNNNPWSKNSPSPWIQPWEMEKLASQKPHDATRSWEKEGSSQTENSPWLKDISGKRDIDRAELSGYVGNILAKLGNFNVMPPKLPGAKGEGFQDDTSDKTNESNVDGEKKAVRSEGSQRGNDGDEYFLASQGDPGCPEGNEFGGKLPKPFESSQFPSQFENEEKDMGERRDDRQSFRREGRIAFGRDDLRNFTKTSRDDHRHFGSDSDRFGCRDENRAFGRIGRDDRCFGRLPREDDDRFGSRNGRRGFDRFDRDDRDGRGFFDRPTGGRGMDGLPDRFCRDREHLHEPVWKPQVFDYSQGRPLRMDVEEGFKISTVVDYSHGENKQTFDYGHGENGGERPEVKPFDYGHGGGDGPTVIDYGHGVDSNAVAMEVKGDRGRDCEKGSEEGMKSNSKTQSPMKRSRSPRGRVRSRSRSPHSRFKRTSVSPYKNHPTRCRDRLGRLGLRAEKNGSEDKLSPPEGDLTRHSFNVTTVLVEDLICRPGRESRPNKLVFIMRGLPGSGKTYVTKLIKDKEVELGGDPPRILSLDDYFITEVEKEVIDEDTGRKIKSKVMEYEYEAGAEPHYKGSLVKAFKKTVSDGFFGFIIVDSVNEKTKDYEEMWSFAKQKGFQVYIAEMDNDVTVCTGRNIHKRTEKEISDLAKLWEQTPTHYLRLDVRSLLQSDAITEVEMEVVSDTELENAAGKEEGDTEKEEEEKSKEANGEEGSRENEKEKEDEEEDEPGVSTFVKSRWDQFENSEQNLDRLDGLKRRREGFHATMEDYLQLPDDFEQDVRDSVPGKKRVRWADLEERKQQEKMRAIGFVVGQTDWSRMTDPTFGESALTRTKYI